MPIGPDEVKMCFCFCYPQQKSLFVQVTSGLCIAYTSLGGPDLIRNVFINK